MEAADHKLYTLWVWRQHAYYYTSWMNNIKIGGGWGIFFSKILHYSSESSVGEFYIPKL